MFGQRIRRKRPGKKPATGRNRMFHEAFRPETKTRVRPRPDSGRMPSWWTWILWVLFLSVVAYEILFSPMRGIVGCPVSGNDGIPSDLIERFVREEWTKPVLFVFPGDNILLFRTDTMEEKLLARFPKLSEANVKKIFPDRIDIAVRERDRIPLFCSRGDCFLVGRDGLAEDASQALLPENDPFVIRIEDASGREIGIGEPMLVPELPDIALSLERGFREELGLRISSPITMPARVSREFRFRTGDGWEIYASSDILPEKTVESLRIVLERDLPEERREKLRYVDLRTENRVFYAFEAEENGEDGKGDGEEENEERDGDDGDEEPDEDEGEADMDEPDGG